MLSPNGMAGGKVGHRQTPYKVKDPAQKAGSFALRDARRNAMTDTCSFIIGERMDTGADMNKFLKYGLWSIGGLVLLVASALTYVALTFDPNAYKPEIMQAVKNATQRTLKLDGDIELTFFPSIGARLGAVSFSEFQSEQEFVSIESANVSLALWPLLTKQIVINQVTLSGAKLRVVKHKNGTFNLDDLVGKQPTTDEPAETPQANAPVHFDVAALADVQRVYRFLAIKNVPAAREAVKAIRQSVNILAQHPEVGRPLEEMEPEYREWPISFGSSGYVALYRFDGQSAIILAQRQ